MSPERIAKKKKAVKKQNLTVVEKVALRNPILRKRRILASLWARLEKIEKRVPKSLEEAVEISRQSRRWRKRLSLFTKLKAVATRVMPCLWIAGEKNYCWERNPEKNGSPYRWLRSNPECWI